MAAGLGATARGALPRQLPRSTTRKEEGGEADRAELRMGGGGGQRWGGWSVRQVHQGERRRRAAGGLEDKGDARAGQSGTIGKYDTR